MLRLLCDLHKHVLNFGNCLASNLRGGGGGARASKQKKEKKQVKWCRGDGVGYDEEGTNMWKPRRGEEEEERESLAQWQCEPWSWLAATDPLVSSDKDSRTSAHFLSLSLSISSFLPSLSPPPPLPAPNPLLHSFLFFFLHSPKVHMDRPVGNHVRPRRVTLFLSFFYCFHMPAAPSFLCPLVFSLPPRASSVRWSSSNDRSRGLLLRTTKCSCERSLHQAEGE